VEEDGVCDQVFLLYAGICPLSTSMRVWVGRSNQVIWLSSSLCNATQSQKELFVTTSSIAVDVAQGHPLPPWCQSTCLIAVTVTMLETWFFLCNATQS
jgi:hypothetical protein